ncbi:helix-turn-helix domain-containing protein (plasmid) [Pantoea agglomerans]|jgi:SOS-response transcriptional repressor LexA|uniref:S24 family peptidase n=1 Tax=Enterobacter agglomerans TaxID=549 RepID=UPI0003B1B6F7|nr:S24 family peptidase [Pantoea agglomerans]ERM09624.1 repressor [Pantoea agglomerans Tx10]KYM71626.1 hypothetical protein A3L21_20985 [Pantoea agglomerans]KYN63137.1 hypothetical protein IU46_018545 [Pantoea agglomerans]MBD8262608.1 helix-turn-helix domain-containing protein [Pantoea agglomerans]MVT81265.1 helix-turn-helix domain-containing protein [Pantoea agglomerans]
MTKKNLITDEDILVSKRLREIWDAKKEELGLSQEKAAGRMGFSTQAAVSQFLNGRIALNKENVLKFAELLGVSPEEIDPSIEPLLKPIRLAERKKNSVIVNNVTKFPFYTSEQVLEIYKNGKTLTPISYIPAVKEASKDAFWIAVSGHSMTAAQGIKPSFPEGVIILVDPGIPVTTGGFCIASLDKNTSLTFKKYDLDAGLGYLVPLNAAYRTLKCDDDTKLIGSVIHTQWPEELFR